MTFKQLLLAVATVFVVASTLTTPSLLEMWNGLMFVVETIVPVLTSSHF